MSDQKEKEQPKISNEEFTKRFDQLIDRLWTIQDRICELKEFEKQWENVFIRLKEITGKDCRVNILNHSAYRAYHYDKYQVLVSDLLSLQENELDFKNESALIRQSINHLRLLTPEEYIVAVAKLFKIRPCILV